jgi:hypothetical protein
MKTTFGTIFVLALAAILSMPAAAQNPAACGSMTTRGVYVVSCGGFITPGPNAPSLPFTILGTVTGDESGAFKGTARNSVAGQQSNQDVSGQAQTRPDCTGTITYNKGQKDEINVRYVVVNNGDEMRGMISDPGANVSCLLTRIQR